MSLINSLYSARSGLRAANAGVNATSNNVANSATPGYNRRNVEQTTNNPIRDGRVYYGTGNVVTGIGRSSDNLLTMRRLRESGNAMSSETEYLNLATVERLFDESQGDTVRTELDAFFDSLAQATADPSDVGLRRQVAHTGDRFAYSVKRTATTLNEARESYANNIESTLVGVNHKLEEIAHLNAQIHGAGGAMGAGDLADRRDQLIRDLAETVGVTADLTADGQATVYMGGHAVVSRAEARTLSIDKSHPITLNVNAGAGTIAVTEDAGGEVGGYLSSYAKTSNYIDQLNTLTIDFSNAINTQHNAGFDRSGTAGGNLFSFTAGDEAQTLEFSSTVMDDVELLAFAANAAGDAGDGDNLELMLGLQDANIIDGGTATAHDFAVALTTEVGNDVAEAERTSITQHNALDDLDELYMNLHGVDMDEEAANLVMYQSAYQASAKVISVTNELMSNLLNLV